MSAGLAHEFKNAIAALHGYAQFLQSIDHDERGKSAAAALLQEVRGLSDMVTAFLNFARPQPLQLEEVMLEEMIEECAHELRPLFNSRRVELIVEGESTQEKAHRKDAEHAEKTQKLEIHADTRMLRQALLNLLRNAAEAIPETKDDRRVIVRTPTEGEPGNPRWPTISIQDSCEPIPVSDLHT